MNETPAPRQRWYHELLPALAALTGVAVAGVALGLAWYAVAPTLPLRKVEDGLAYSSPEPEQQVAMDGWFVILGFAFGILAAIAVWALLKRWRGPIQIVALALGAVAAGFLAWQVGTKVPHADYQAQAKSAPVGTIVEKPADLSIIHVTQCVDGGTRCVKYPAGELLVPALASVVMYALLAGWSRWPSLRRTEDEETVLLHQPEDPFSSAGEPGRAG